MSGEELSDRVHDGDASPVAERAAPRKAPYEAPRIEKRRSVARVTLVSGMGQMGVGVVGRMG